VLARRVAPRRVRKGAATAADGHAIVEHGTVGGQALLAALMANSISMGRKALAIVGKMAVAPSGQTVFRGRRRSV
jgi:hypothetical protein